MPIDAETRSGWRAVLAFWLASRAALWGVALLASALLPLFRDRPLLNFTHPRPPAPVLGVWARWDSEWYLAIAEGGYRYEIRDPLQRARYPRHPTAGFFPLYPWLIRLLTPLAGSGVAAGWWISNLALPGFLLVWHQMLREDLGGPAARRGVVYFLCLPASLFCSAVYAESLFLLLCALCLWSLRRGRWLGAGGAAFAAALARPAGALLIVPMLLEAWRSSRAGPGAPDGTRGGVRRPASVLAAWLAPLAPAAGLAVFAGVCARAFGDALAFLHRQEAWRGTSGPPWRAFVRYFESGPAAHGVHDSTLELVFALAFLALLWAGLPRMRRAEWAFCLVAVLGPLCTSLFSFSRLALAAFPLLALPAAWGEREWVDRTLAFLLISVQALFVILFQGWGWAA